MGALKPKIGHHGFRYTRLQILNWILGAPVTSVTSADAGSGLWELLADEDASMPFFVDCKNVYDITQYSMRFLVDMLKTNPRYLIFVNCEPKVLEELRAQLHDLSPWVPAFAELPTNTLFVKREYPSLDSAALTLKLPSNVVEGHVFRLVQEAFRSFDGQLQPLRSVPVRASGYFDARSLIGDPAKLIWVAAMMADLTAAIIGAELEQQDGPLSGRNVRLLAVTRNGASIAACIRRLNEFPSLDVVDRYGPSQEIMAEHTLGSFHRKGAYILVGDFIVCGSEVKVAEAHSYHRNAELTHAIVIGSVLRPDEYPVGCKIRRIVDLTQCRKDFGDLKYTFGD